MGIIMIDKVYIQSKWANKILDGEKSIETRHFGLHPKYWGVPLYIQTENRVLIGQVIFKSSFKYRNVEDFDRDYGFHLVDKKSQFHFTKRVRTCGWFVGWYRRLREPKLAKPFKGQFPLQLATDTLRPI